MPLDFETCVRDGGRVRTKSMPDGKFMRICFDKNGKSHAGEVMVKKESDNEFQRLKKLGANLEESMNDLSLVYQFKESKVDKEQRTVVCGVLEEDCLSANNRFYPASIVREAIGGLSGKKALVGHESDSPMDVVAVIEKSEMQGRLGVGHFRFGKDQVSETMLQKVKDGLVNSVSIRANGETKPGKVNNNEVDIVQKLDIFSVDFVVEGGVSSAKVLQVFESSPTIEYQDSKLKQEEDAMNEELKKQLDEANAKIKSQEEARIKLEEEKAKLEEEKKAAEIEAYKAQKLASIEDKEFREEIAKGLKGKTKEELDEQFAYLKNLLEKSFKKAGSKIVLEPVKEGDGNFKDLNSIFESPNVKKEEKVEILKELMKG